MSNNGSAQFDVLLSFAAWFLAQPMTSLRPPQFALNYFGEIMGVVLYRREQFQVELFIITPNNHGFPDHCHPNVDALEVALAGKLFFTLEGIRQATDEQVNGVCPDGSALICGNYTRVKDGQTHGAKVGKEGGIFLSIQHWKNGVTPTSVGDDWQGEPHGEEFKKVRREQAVGAPI